MDYYILYSYLLVSLVLMGPFNTPEERDKEVKNLYQKYGNDTQYYKITVPKGTQIEIDSYPEEFLAKE